MPSRIAIPEDQVAAFCRRNGIRRLALFGSALRGELRPDSDLDLLVDFEPGKGVGLFSVIRLEQELSALLGRRVDLRTEAELSRYFRDEVKATAEVLYAA